jgi:hypothetical protein
MKKFIILLICFTYVTLFGLTSCSKKSDPSIVGTWVYDHIEDSSIYVYVRAASFKENKRGLKFSANGELLSHESLCVWCEKDEPPFRYYEGEWRSIGENEIELTSSYWYGNSWFKANVTVTGNTLRFQFK